LVVITAERYEARRKKASQASPAEAAKRVRQLGLR
jgi:hypothetical protein